MTGFSAPEAELLFDASFAFFRGKLRDSDSINDHGVKVVGFGVGRVGEGVVVLVRGLRISFGDVVRSLPLGLEGNSFLVPFVNGGRDSVHGHDAAHQGQWDPHGEVSDQDVGEGHMVLESGNVFRQRGGVRVVLSVLHHAFGG